MLKDIVKNLEPSSTLKINEISKKLEKKSLIKISNTNFWADITKTKEQLNWSPKISFEELVKEMVVCRNCSFSHTIVGEKP